MSSGYLSWPAGQRYIRDRFMLDGYVYENNCMIRFTESDNPGIPPLKNALGTGGTQTAAIGGNQPANLGDRIFDVEIDAGDADDYARLLQSASKHGLVSFMPGTWVMDLWNLQNANEDPTTWRTSRGIWLGSPTNTTLYAPKFTKRTGSDAAWTVLHTGSPGAAEALFPAATTTTPFDITTAALDETETAELWAQYMGVHWVRVTLKKDQGAPNDLKVTFQAEEVLIGSYTGLA